MRAIAIIPARYDSSRFPGKPLASIHGKPMICWVVEGALRSSLLSDAIVATDDQRIFDKVIECGHQAVMTSAAHTSGSDRVWEASCSTDADIIVNIQGDEPAISGELIDACIRPFLERDDLDVVTAKTAILDSEDLLDPNTVKVVTDDDDCALYFSRSPIPHGEGEHFSHVGIYAYKRAALEKFCALPPAGLEKMERLEQLRGLAAGMRYYVIETATRPVDVNTPDDIQKVEHILKRYVEENQ